ncbi:hypothetical protein [Dyella sp.]|jgi:hypothetical protein|uniref:hypothetical protein n=1 Tax=Dyella sp. TaxID=1869338 RepID=UPI002D7660AE|nr:hypothetical protein [Dyella sp.]HET6430781.1 hypothetical protein [Dyella sp.]
MNDLAWRRQMRELRQPQPPSRDLWAAIEQSLEAAPGLVSTVSTERSGPRTPWWLAASLAAVTVLAVGLMHQADTAALTSAQLAEAPRWKPDDPRLAGAAIELNAAQYELRQAIQQAPDSSALQRLLDRTEQQQSRLRQLGHGAS